MIEVTITAVSRADLLKQAEEIFGVMFSVNVKAYADAVGVAAGDAIAGTNGKGKAKASSPAQVAETTESEPAEKPRRPRKAAAEKAAEAEPEAEAAPAQPVPAKITVVDLRRVLKQYIDAFTEADTVSLLAEHGNGATKISLLDEQYYDAVYAAAVAALPKH